MKLKRNEKYFNIAAYSVLSVLIVLGGVFILLNFRLVWEWIKMLFSLAYGLVEPLLVGAALAYLLEPIVIFYESKCQQIHAHHKFHLPRHLTHQKKKRWQMRTVPTLLTFLSLIALIGLFVLMIQMNIKQVSGNFSMIGLRESIASYVEYFEEMVSGISDFTVQMGIVKGKGLVESVYERVNRFVIYLYNEFTGGILEMGVHAFNALLGGVIAFYLLQDKKRVLVFTKRVVSLFVNHKHYQKVIEIGKKADEILSGYIRGEIIDSMIIIILTSGALLLIRLDFAIIIGVISGIFNLIPYFGPIVGFVLAVIIGLLDPEPIKALYAAIAILIIQQIDGWFIVPKVVGNCVRLHPIIVLLAILVGGNLFGLIGMLLAVPVAAFIRLLLCYWKPGLFRNLEE